MSIFKLAKKGYGLLGRTEKSTDTVKIKPSGKKTETETYLKNRKEPTTYKSTQDRNIESAKAFDKANKKELSKGEEALKGLKNYFKEAEKSPEMKAYRKKQKLEE